MQPDAGQVSASIEGDGDYYVSYTVQGDGSGTVECMILSTDINSYAYAPDGAGAGTNGVADGCTVDLAISSIVVTRTDGTETEITYNGPSDGAFAVENDGVSLRVNIYNIWGNDVTDIDSTIDGGIATGDTITVNFTVSGMDYATGDVDGDGVITMHDAYLTYIAYLRVLVGTNYGLTAAQETAADVNGNSEISFDDSYYISYTFCCAAVGLIHMMILILTLLPAHTLTTRTLIKSHLAQSKSLRTN